MLHVPCACKVNCPAPVPRSGALSGGRPTHKTPLLGEGREGLCKVMSDLATQETNDGEALVRCYWALPEQLDTADDGDNRRHSSPPAMATGDSTNDSEADDKSSDGGRRRGGRRS